jgi:alcohol dehydrogenase
LLVERRARGRSLHRGDPRTGAKVNIPAGLRELNVKEEDFAVLATNALKDACGFTNPIQATHEEIMAIYRAAM